MIALLGAWGALIPFVGPYFDYSFGINSTWHYTTDRLWLCVLPGALALLAGLMLLTARTRVTGAFAGWLAIVAGAWFVIGPAVSLTWESGAGPIGPPLFGTTRQMAELIGYFYGLGALIVAFGAFAVGRFAPGPRMVDARPAGTGEPVTAAPEGEPTTTAAPRRTTPGAEPIRRRGRLHLPGRSRTVR